MIANSSQHFEPGDIIACYGTDAVSRIISAGTFSLLAPRGTRIAPSHVALISEIDGSPWWCESTMLADRECVLQKRKVRGVQVHYPEDRTRDYVYSGGQVVVFRLSPIDQLAEEDKANITQMVRGFINQEASYDTIGALISGTRVLKRTRLIPFLAKWLHIDLDSLFCSEMIAAILQRTCRMNRDNPTKYSPGSLVRELIDQGTYKIAGELSADENGVFWI
jgi:hypothetical protein